MRARKACCVITLLTDFLVSDQMPKGQAVDELVLAIECYTADDCKNLVRHFPL